MELSDGFKKKLESFIETLDDSEVVEFKKVLE